MTQLRIKGYRAEHERRAASPGVFTPRSAGVLIGDVAHLVVFLRPSEPLSSPLEPQLKIRLTAESPGGQPARSGAGRGPGHGRNKL